MCVYIYIHMYVYMYIYIYIYTYIYVFFVRKILKIRKIQTQTIQSIKGLPNIHRTASTDYFESSSRKLSLLPKQVEKKATETDFHHEEEKTEEVHQELTPIVKE